MPRQYLFADEAGCFAFKRGNGASRYYIVCTILMESCEVGHDLLALRRRLSWEGRPLRDYFHCSPEKQEIRDEVFAVLQQHPFTVHATIMEKSKAQPQTRTSEDRFYKYGWLYHLRHSTGLYLRRDSELHITAATIGTKKKRVAFEDAIRDVCRQVVPTKQFRTAFWPCETDPCLQAADYCTWAIQRKWEMGDTRSYDLIADRVTYEYDLWQRGTHHYY
jgi:hypothetical protein